MKPSKWSARRDPVLSGAPLLAFALAAALGAAPTGGHAKEGVAAAVKPTNGASTAATRLNGKLGNGLAYHIEKAGAPGGETSFRLVVRVGQLHGLPEQQVAHVVEHIVIEKLRDKAAKGSVWDRASRIGAHVNAGTGDTSTNYYVDLPASNPAAAAEALAILLDWASPGALSDEEIDRERKAVIEEARQGGYGEENRLATAQLATLFPDHSALVAPRDPIGSLSATAPTIRSLYAAYYVPSNMAIVIVGDIDPAATLRAIAERLGTLAAGNVPRAAVTKIKTRLGGGRYVPMARKESSETNLALVYKIPPARPDITSRARVAAIVRIAEGLTREAFAALSGRRERNLTGSLSYSKGPPSLGGPGADYVTIGAAIGRRTGRDALADALLVAETMRTRGFPAADVERAKAEALKTEIATTTVQDIAGRWTSYYADGTFAPAAADIRTAIAGLAAADVNQALQAWLNPAHRDIFLLYPEADAATVPTAAEIPVLAAAAKRGAPIDLSVPSPRELRLALAPVDLGAAPPAPDAVPEAEGYLRWTLPRSGATLLFRKQEGGKVRLLMRRRGGAARFDAASAMSARAIPEIVASSGMGSLSGPELVHYLGERNLRLSTSASATYEQASAAGLSTDWPSILALLRERMSKPECSDKAFRTYVDGARDALDVKGEASDADALNRLVDAGLGGKWRPDAADLDAMNLAAMCEQYRTMFGDSVGMTIVVEGDLDPAQVYAGASLALDRPGTIPKAPVALRTLPETQAGRTTLRQGTKPSARVSLAIAANDDAPFAGVMAEALQLAVFRRLRSVEKGTYSPMSGVTGDTTPGRVILSIYFECAPENVDRLVAAAKEEIDRLGRAGPSDADIAAWRAQSAERTRDAGAIAEAWIAKHSVAEASPATDTEIRAWAGQFFRSSRMHEFVLLPE